MSTVGRSESRLFGLGLTITLFLAVVTRSGALYLTAALVALTGGASAIWGRYALSRVTYSRTLSRSRVFVGETVELRVELTNRKILPVNYLRVEETVPEALEVHARKVRFLQLGKGMLQMLYSLAWYQKIVRHLQVTATRRGYYQLGPARLYGGDPFGYVTGEMEVLDPVALIVYPRMVSLEALGFPTRRPFGDLKGGDRLFEDPLRFAGVREYQPGDPMSRVHWKASATTGRWQVKLLDPSSNPGISLFLNTWGYDRFWQGFGSQMETQCSVAASIAGWAVENQVSVGLYANGLVQGWGMNLGLPPARGPHVLPALLEGLARLQLPSRSTITDLLLANLPRLGYGTTLVIITGSLPEELAGTLLRVRESGRPVTLVLVGDEQIPVDRLPGVQVLRVSGEEALHATALHANLLA